MGYSLRRHVSEDLLCLLVFKAHRALVYQISYLGCTSGQPSDAGGIYSDTWFPNQPDLVTLSLNTS